MRLKNCQSDYKPCSLTSVKKYGLKRQYRELFNRGGLETPETLHTCEAQQPCYMYLTGVIVPICIVVVVVVIYFQTVYDV